MPKITIVGAGQAGLQLAHCLIKQGLEVSLIANRSAAQIRAGGILSTQGMFATALQHERDLGLNYFENQGPKNTHVSFNIAEKDKAIRAIHWTGKVSAPFQAIDQRMKFSRWMDEFEKLGGTLHIQDVSANDLNHLAKETELLIIASGKSDISKLFQRDDSKSKYHTPQRSLSAMYVHGMSPSLEPGVKANLIPGVGEYFCMPGLTLSGHCEMMLFEGMPGGAFDCWKQAESPDAYVDLAKALLKKYIPWEAERCQHISLTDPQAVLRGQYTPIVRKPFIRLADNHNALGLGDIVILNDPISGQGANNASRAAAFLSTEIAKQGSKKFNESWMSEVSNKFWQQEARWSTLWTNLLLEPPRKHLIELLIAAQESPFIADTLAQAFENPASMFPWILSPKLTHDFIDSAQASPKDHFHDGQVFRAPAP